MKELRFSVDSALFRELGERLVGRPHIALAELIKNSYDADATQVKIRIGRESIEVADNGHGMTLEEFRGFWMRVGSPHKQEQRITRRFGRQMTGSKGVGRLSAQFLAKEIEVRTVSDRSSDTELQAFVDWREAVTAGELTEAVARYQQIDRETSFPNQSPHGTAIILTDLSQEWGTDDLVRLAREIWWLQPPFGRKPNELEEPAKAFDVELVGPDPATAREFESQMEAYHDIWHARLVGNVETLSRGKDEEKSNARRVKIELEFAEADQVTQTFDAPEHCPRNVDFEIRVYHLQHRQPRGIRVGKAREYFRKHGGIHVYDAGFHLPYYGPDNDWLNIEMDHSHRLAKSKLLPEELQISEGLTYLPTQSRILGVVHVNTAQEQEVVEAEGRAEEGDYLKIQVTRDRLVDNDAYQALREVVRWAVDFYAMQEAKRVLKEAEAAQDVEPVHRKFERVEDVLRHYKDAIPEDVYGTLHRQVGEAIRASQTEAEARARQVGLLGSLATAGMTALAYEHQAHQQLTALGEIATELRNIDATKDPADAQRRLTQVSGMIEAWVERARELRGLFTHLLEEENREKKARLRAKAVLQQVHSQLRPFFRGIEFDAGSIPEHLRLPPGRFAEWSTIFQNVFLNAINALLDAQTRKIVVQSSARARARALIIQDTGVGVDLSNADRLFEPFERHLEISEERRQLGLGGSGLGLTIVRMLAEKLKCKVAFTEPSAEFSTAFRISWKEQE